MKKFKLIKKYPGSSVVGTIFFQQEGYGGISWQEPNVKTITSGGYLTMEIIENNPEYWVEVIEKDYEILSFGFNGGFDRVLDEHGFYKRLDSKYGVLSLDTMLTLIKTPNQYFIKSVKRLSDGEIFTVGDNVKIKHIDDLCFKYAIGSREGNVVEIVEILLKDKNKNIKALNSDAEGIFIYEGHHIQNGKNFVFPLFSLEKVKQPLFATKDNVNIYPGSVYYMFNTITCTLHKATASNDTISPEEHWLTFSDVKAANKIIDFCKIRYSNKDIFNIIHRGFDRRTATVLGKHKILSMFNIGPLPNEQEKTFTIAEIDAILDKHFQEWNSSTMIDRQVLKGLLQQK